MPEETGTASISGRGGGLAGPGGGLVAFCGLDFSPQPLGGFSLSHHSPLLGFAQTLFSELKETQGQEQRARQCLPLKTICFIALKPAREKLPPSCYSLCSPEKPHSAPPQLSCDTPLTGSLVRPPQPLPRLPMHSICLIYATSPPQKKFLGGTPQGHLKYRVKS